MPFNTTDIIEKGINLVKERKYSEASFYFLNALSKKPGDIKLIEMYASHTLELAHKENAAGRKSEAIQNLAGLHSFLLDRARYVEESDLSMLIEWFSKTNNMAAEFSKEPETPPDPETVFLHNLFDLASSDEGLPSEVPAKQDLSNEIKKLEDLLDYALSERNEKENSPIVIKIRQRINALRARYEYFNLVDEIGNIMSIARSQKTTTARAYCLQVGEGIIRQMLMMRKDVGEELQKEADRCLKEMMDESKKIALEEQKQESEKKWADFIKDNEDQIRLSNSWLRKTAYHAEEYCENQIQRIKKLLENLSKIARAITSEEVINIATKFQEEFGNKMQEAYLIQQKAYNKWAMDWIQCCWNEGIECISVVDMTTEHRKLGNIIVKNLGNIDVRLLSNDVLRCYQEVFQYLFENLWKPKKKDHFSEEGYKLWVAKQLSETDNWDYSKF